jgi:hypothetical protein
LRFAEGQLSPWRSRPSAEAKPETSQVGAVGNLEPDPDGYREQEQHKRKSVFAERIPREK